MKNSPQRSHPAPPDNDVAPSSDEQAPSRDMPTVDSAPDNRHPLRQEKIHVGSAGAFDATEEVRGDEESDEDNDDLAGTHAH